MAYLHCHGRLPDGTACGWSQDDFWDQESVVDGKPVEGYTPLKSSIVKDMRRDLFRNRVYFDSGFFNDHPEIPHKVDSEGKSYCKGTDLVAWGLERKAKSIRNMLVRTYDEFKEKRDELVCPRCGQQKWDID